VERSRLQPDFRQQADQPVLLAGVGHRICFEPSSGGETRLHGTDLLGFPRGGVAIAGEHKRRRQIDVCFEILGIAPQRLAQVDGRLVGIFEEKVCAPQIEEAQITGIWIELDRGAQQRYGFLRLADEGVDAAKQGVGVGE
jgi:hypothetical protein